MLNSKPVQLPLPFSRINAFLERFRHQSAVTFAWTETDKHQLDGLFERWDPSSPEHPMIQTLTLDAYTARLAEGSDRSSNFHSCAGSLSGQEAGDFPISNAASLAPSRASSSSWTTDDGDTESNLSGEEALLSSGVAREENDVTSYEEEALKYLKSLLRTTESGAYFILQLLLQSRCGLAFALAHWLQEAIAQSEQCASMLQYGGMIICSNSEQQSYSMDFNRHDVVMQVVIPIQFLPRGQEQFQALGEAAFRIMVSPSNAASVSGTVTISGKQALSLFRGNLRFDEQVVLERWAGVLGVSLLDRPVSDTVAVRVPVVAPRPVRPASASVSLINASSMPMWRRMWDTISPRTDQVRQAAVSGLSINGDDGPTIDYVSRGTRDATYSDSSRSTSPVFPS